MRNESTPISRRRLVAAGSALAVGALLERSVSANQGVTATPGTTAQAYPVTITHVNGETTLEQQPQRIVALEWSLVEDVLALGVQPVGIADVEGYRAWVSVPLELPDDVVDVGQRLEPSVEAIAALEPDLILAIDWRHEAFYDQLSRLAPTILVPFDVRGDDITPLQNLHDRVTVVGQALNRPEEAADVFAQMEQTLSDQATRLEEAGLASQPFVFAYWYSADPDPTMRLFSNEHIVGEAIAALGIGNAWQGEGEESGFSTVSYEALVSLPEDIHFIYVPADTDAAQQQLADDPILSSLPFVQDGRAYGLGPDTWTNPGAVGVEVLVTRVADALTGSVSEA